MGGTQWTRFIVKNNKSYYFDGSGGSCDNFLLKQLLKPIIYHSYKLQDINSNLCGSYCIYFFYLIERMKYYDSVFKICFDQINANNCTS